MAEEQNSTVTQRLYEEAYRQEAEDPRVDTYDTEGGRPEEPEEEEFVSQDEERPLNGLEKFFSGKLGNGKMTWGLILLSAFAIYAIVQLILSILYFF